MSINKLLRIAQVAPVIFPTPPVDHGGTERVVSDLTEALVALGHDVTLYAPSDSVTSARLRSAHPSLSALERAAGGPVAPGVPGVLEAAQLDMVARAIDEHDIVHVHGEFAHAAVLAGRPALTTIHWRVDELDRKLFFAHFDRLQVAAISGAQAADIPASNLAGVVHHGIAEDRYRLGDGAGGYLAFIGRMTDQKRPDVAIRVARAAGRPIRLAGTIDVGNPRYFEDRVRPLLGTDAEYVGPVDDGAKQGLLGDAAALLFPIDWPEPFGLVMIEAMACGTPVIAWDRGSVREVIEEGVTGFVVRDETEALAAIARLPSIDRAQVRRRFEARFGARRMATDYVALYRTVLGAQDRG
ncbi:glycosyltransferase family 4 protein [Sphingomonas arantia]|uniref:Glycosyltransferase family 4 protein n=1 Tax=Sphingomonas arantia TaxID=1460676 RepID=A0ABW4TYI3_9SPHN